MAKVNALLYSFNEGEFTRAGMARIDQTRVKLAAEIQENVFPYVVGKGLVRPGTQFLGDTASDARPRLLPFIKAADDSALLELSNTTLRVWVDDALVTRAAVTAPITNGDFSSSSGWTTGTTGGATADINSTVAGALYLAGNNRGGLASCEQQVTTANVGTEHALAIAVARGPVTFRCGATEGGDEYIGETTLDTGVYSLAFTPTGVIAGADSFTKLLLHCDGIDTSTTFTDSSASPHTVTANGDAQIDTAQKKFGTGSGLFDGTGDYLGLDGSSDFAFGTGDFTIEMWVNPSSISAIRYLYDSAVLGSALGTTAQLRIQNGYVQFANNATQLCQSTSALVAGVWSHIAVTRASGVTRLFVNGVQQASAADTSAYVNAAARPRIAALGQITSPSNFFNGWIDEVRVSKGIARWTGNFIVPSAAYSGTGNTFWVKFFSTNERAAVVDSIQVESAGVMSLTAPWGESDLDAISFDQSLDVVFLAHPNWQQRKIERHNDTSTSWGVVLYKSDDGPFTTKATAAVRLKPGATRGNTTLTAEQSFFRPEHVGALFRVSHEATVESWGLAAENKFTDAVRVHGINAEGTSILPYAITGTWVGTLTLQSSLISDSDGFADTTTTTTINVSTNFAPNATHDNVATWLRWGFKSGNYTSGAANIQFTYTGSGGSGVCRVTSYTSPTSVNVEVLSDFKNTVYTDDWKEGAWSDAQDWPSAVRLFDGRLWFAGSDKIWGSESDDYYAFNLDTVGDAGSIQRNVATGGMLADARWMLALQRLIIGSAGSESSARASSIDQPLTPTNFTLKDASTQGVASVAPAKVDGRGIFVQRSGKQVYAIALQGQDYASACLTDLNDEIGGDGLTAIAVQRQPQPYIWFVRDDGECPVLLYNPDEKIAAWFRFIAAPCLAGDAVVESVCVLPGATQDVVYLAVQRSINGASVRFVEKLRKHSEATGGNVNGVADASVLNAMADAALLTAGPTSSVTLAHLASETGLIGWGTLVSSGVAGPITGLSADASGVVALPASYTNVWVGLKYDWRYKSAKLAYAAQKGTALLQRKKVGPVGLLAADIMYGAIQFGPDFTTMDPLPLEKDGTTVSQTTVYAEWDEPQFPFPGGWDTDSRLCMKGSAPYPATLLGIVAGIETHES